MAQQVLVQLVDDLDGTISQEVSTVLFGLDGVSYEIDLSDDNAERLRESLQEFVDVGRRTGGRLKQGVRPGQAGKANRSSEAGQIREWASRNGYELAGRGRIPSHVVEAYQEAKAEPAPKGRTRTKKR